MLGLDANTNPLDEGFTPFLLINPTPGGQSLVNHQFGYRFLPSFTNAIYSLITRVLAVPQIEFPDSFIDIVTWYNIAEKPTLTEAFVIPEYIENLKPHQRVRINNAFLNLESNYSFSSSTDCFAKSDELLFKKKARIIWNVPPGFQAVLGPMVRQMTLFLKETLANGHRIFSSIDFTTSNWHDFLYPQQYTLCFACGMTSVHLDEWFNHSLFLLTSKMIQWAGIFMGDDTFVLYLDKDTGLIQCFESDYSAYDSTQREAAQSFLREVYSCWGVPKHVLEFFKKMASAPLKVKYGRERKCSFKIKLKTPQTATGKPDTCLGNTILNIHATVHSLLTPASFSDFGFVAKVHYHKDFSHGTFLKGFWCLGTDGLYHWGPLPSASMKLLKSFIPVDTLEEGLSTNLSSIGPVSTPLVRVLISRFAPSIFLKPATDFKIFSTSAPSLSIPALENFLSYRYGRDALPLFYELEALLRVVKLGEYCYHPLWKILADVDYGDGRADSHLV